MKATVSAQGYTSVIMVMSMNRFVRSDDWEKFQALRGTDAFHEYIQKKWLPALANSPLFIPVDEDVQKRGQSQRMSITEVGFSTGIFRQNVLEKHMFPTYQFNKDAYKFPASLESNYQFRHIFKPLWDSWDIFVRSSMLGMLNIRLYRHYQKATPLEQITSDVIRLQAPFDIPSAIQWLEKLKKELADDQVAFSEKQESVEELLSWLGSSIKSENEDLDYSPVQWQLAMEIGRAFISTVGLQIDSGGHQVSLWNPPPSLSHPLHDSYVIHHLDKIYASPYVLPSYREKMAEEETETADKTLLVQVMLDDLEGSFTVKQRLMNMLEGSILRRSEPQEKQQSSRYFPRLKKTRLDKFLDDDLSTWFDELCLINSRIALIIPSHSDRYSNLFISTLPITITTSHIQYLWYWDAIERMVEFVAEIRVLAQLLEHASARLLQTCVDIMHRKRQGMITGNGTRMMKEFMQTIEQTANLSRLLAICQTLSNPATWSRADFALNKATHLLDQFAVPTSLQHAAENISNLNALLEHLDELNLSDTEKQQERINFWSSIGFAAISMVLTLLILPSFWADLNALEGSNVSEKLLALVRGSGNVLSMVLLGLSLVLMGIAFASLWKANRNNSNKEVLSIGDEEEHMQSTSF